MWTLNTERNIQMIANFKTVDEFIKEMKKDVETNNILVRDFNPYYEDVKEAILTLDSKGINHSETGNGNSLLPWLKDHSSLLRSLFCLAIRWLGINVVILPIYFIDLPAKVLPAVAGQTGFADILYTTPYSRRAFCRNRMAHHNPAIFIQTFLLQQRD